MNSNTETTPHGSPVFILARMYLFLCLVMLAAAGMLA